MNSKRETLRNLRKLKGTQEQVASEIGMSTVYLRMIENGKFTPGRDLMFRMASFFEVNVYELFPEFADKELKQLQNR